MPNDEEENERNDSTGQTGGESAERAKSIQALDNRNLPAFRQRRVREDFEGDMPWDRETSRDDKQE